MDAKFEENGVLSIDCDMLDFDFGFDFDSMCNESNESKGIPGSELRSKFFLQIYSNMSFSCLIIRHRFLLSC
jgi:hypothetical protein